MSLPTGTVTFLFTDIEGSTRFWEQHPETMRDALARHDVLMHQAIAHYEGIVFKTVGDAFCAAFATAPLALSAALIAQIALRVEPWPAEVPLRVRMALHIGTAEERDGDYFGPPLNRIARLLNSGHGGQILLSQAAQELTRDALPAQCGLQDLGVHSLRDLARPEQVYQLCHPDLLSEFPPLKSLDYLPNNLPQQVTSFIGRERELSQVKDLLVKTRLLTLAGSGGCGKTRLSLQTAADVLDQYSDGVWLVELAPITDPDLVPQAVVAALGMKEQAGQPYTQTLIDWLKTKTLLLVLDNCEHVLSASAKLADTLLRNSHSIKMLASSREGLGIAGETIYRIPSLSLPDPRQVATPESLSQYEAVQLFIERAAASLPAFAVTDANAPALASICHRLDGIPLAIELAAARVRSLSVEELNSKLDNRFRLLTGGSRTALPRQQTLRALIDWSYDLLSGPEKILLCRLSVFAGGWSLAAAEAVCTGDGIEDWECLDLLTGLADKSLVQAEAQTDTTRYRFLETVRQYARDRLAESNAGVVVRARHRDCFLALAEEVAPKLRGPEQAQWLLVLEAEHDNLRQAITFCLGQTEAEEPEVGEKGQRLGRALWRFWEIRGHLSEGRERLAALLTRPEAQNHTKIRGDALNGLGNLVRMQGDTELARSHYAESLDIFRELGDQQGIANALNNLGTVAYHQGNYASARSLQEESLAIKRELGDTQGIANTVNNLGMVAELEGDYDIARSLYAESLTINRELGNRKGIASSLFCLGSLATAQGDYATARSHHEEGLAISRELGNKQGIATSLQNLGMVAERQGDYLFAQSQYAESLILFREIEDRGGLANSLTSLGRIACGQGDHTLARSFYEESLTFYRGMGDKSGIAQCLNNLGNVASDQNDYAVARSFFAESLSLYREMGNRFGIAACVHNLGMVAEEQGDDTLARSLYTESLILFREIGNRNGIAYCLGTFAAFAVKEAQEERAACLFGAVEALREILGSPLPPDKREDYDRQVATVRAALGDDVFTVAWAKGRAMPWEQAVADALAE